ncbi:MAG: M48 family metallopeptidase [Chromatiales bacterium]|nr:M48 family metallopeptidase [Chromatiales bacterium]
MITSLNRAAFVLLSALATGCATSPTGRQQFMLISPEQAISSSAEAYVQTLAPLEKQGKVDSNAVTSERVRTITGRIVTEAVAKFPNTRDWAWSVKVIDDPETVNAWCMAGGKMAVYTGLLEKVKPTDDELAQVMGHEIAHALANHTAEKMSVALASSAAVAGVAIAASDSRYAGAALAGASLAAALAIKLPNSRTAETEADEIGIELAARAGYDPRSAVTLWEKMGKVGGKRVPEFVSTHPAPENRQERLGKLAPKMMPFYQERKPHPIHPLE